MAWIIIEIIAIVLVIFYFRRGRNAVWGGLTLGIIIGLVVMIFKGYDIFLIMKIGSMGTILGFITELLGKLSSKK